MVRSFGLVVVAVRLGLTPTGSAFAQTLVGQFEGLPGDGLGICSADAGDVNLDRSTDIIVGAPGNNRAYVQLGGVSPFGRAPLVLEANVPGAGFGFTVAGLGDVNGDGYSDVIVGQPEATIGGLGRAGKAYIYFGQAVMDASPDWQVSGSTVDELFGWCVASAGDINGDSHPDVAIAAIEDHGAGHVRVYFGGPDFDDIPEWTLVGSSGQFGYQMQGIGDVNNDGFGDLLIGERNLNPCGCFPNEARGHALVFFGHLVPNTDPDIQTHIGGVLDRLGSSVSSAGRFNLDSDLDFIVGAPQLDITGAAHRGYAEVYFGGKDVDNTIDLTLYGEGTPGEEGDAFGESVGFLPDVTGDGYDEIVVGDYQWPAPDQRLGRVYIHFGGTDADDTADLTLTNPEPTASAFGAFRLAACGDFNRNGYKELLVGAPGAADGAGRLYVYEFRESIGVPNVGVVGLGTVFPMPARSSEEIQIHLPGHATDLAAGDLAGQAGVSILDASGRFVTRREARMVGSIASFLPGGLAPGTYFLRLDGVRRYASPIAKMVVLD